MSLSTETLKAIVCEREAGYLIAEIAANHGVSVSAVKSVCRKNGAVKFASRNLLVENARQQLVSDSKLAQRLALETAQAIHSELALAKQIKQAASLLIEQIFDNDSGMSVAVRSRSLAAVATSVITAQALTHKALSLQKETSGANDDDLPKLVIESMTDSEIETAQAQANMTDLELALLEQQGGLNDDGAIE